MGRPACPSTPTDPRWVSSGTVGPLAGQCFSRARMAAGSLARRVAPARSARVAARRCTRLGQVRPSVVAKRSMLVDVPTGGRVGYGIGVDTRNGLVEPHTRGQDPVDGLG